MLGWTYLQNVVTIIMKFEWDQRKNKSNIHKHGLDFADVPEIFDGHMLVRLDTRNEYGEDRWVGIGLIQNRVVVVVYIEKGEGETIRIISLRKALKYEREEYEKTFKN